MGETHSQGGRCDPDKMIARLTENEKSCLRRKLIPETSKEIASALNISVHAVEKRLKTARMKLGTSTSLAAARLLMEAEAKGQSLVPQFPDLSPAPDTEQSDSPPQPHRRVLLAIFLGAISMIGILSYVVLSGGLSVAAIGEDQTPSRAEHFLSESFDLIDRDRSGYIEEGEQPPMKARRIESDGTTGVPAAVTHIEWLYQFDSNGDGRVSREEYVAKLLPGVLKQGVPENWRPRES